MKLVELFEEMKKKPMSLFYGAGICLDCGGPTGTQLFENLKTEYPKGKSSNFFDYMNEII